MEQNWRKQKNVLKYIFYSICFAVAFILGLNIYQKHKIWVSYKRCDEIQYRCYNNLNTIMFETSHLQKIERIKKIRHFLDTETLLINSKMNKVEIDSLDGYVIVNVSTGTSLFNIWDTQKNVESKINYGNLEIKSFFDFIIADQAAFTVYYN